MEIKQGIHMPFLPKFQQYNGCNMDPLGVNSDPHVTFNSPDKLYSAYISFI